MKGKLRLTRGPKIQSPKDLTTRPTSARVREAVMNILGQRILDCNWLDLFSGSGVMGCEALKRGAKNILAIEYDKKTAQICKSNLLLIAEAQTQNIEVETQKSKLKPQKH